MFEVKKNVERESVKLWIEEAGEDVFLHMKRGDLHQVLMCFHSDGSFSRHKDLKGCNGLRLNADNQICEQ